MTTLSPADTLPPHATATAVFPAVGIGGAHAGELEALPSPIPACLSDGPTAGDGLVDERLPDDAVGSGLDKVLLLLRAHNGQDFSHYKKNSLSPRVERRMGIHQIGCVADYVRLLQDNPQELDLLFKELLIGVTSFFRDPSAWDSLRDIALPALFARYPTGHMLRAWVPGCSTGEEAYSLAMTFKESLKKNKPAGRFSLQIFGTDLAHDAIDHARLGHYPISIKADMSAERLARFFVATGDGYEIVKHVRDMVVFAPQNMTQDPPFTKLDLLLCRNVLIYFVSALQKHLLALFHYSLTSGGVLFLGNSETIGADTDLFAPLEAKARIYRRLDTLPHTPPVAFSTCFRTLPGTASERAAPAANLQVLADQLLLRQFVPAAVLVNDHGDIIYISGRTGRYLEPASGKANWNVYAMARDGLRQVLGSALHQVVSDHGRVERDDVSAEDDGGAQRTAPRTAHRLAHRINLTVQYIDDPEPLRGMIMIVFSELRSGESPGHLSAPMTAALKEGELEQGLRRAHDEIGSLHDQIQTAGEALKSANEELQSSNEELQSSNEALTTSKEEMRSLNEALQTVNVALQSRVDDLSSLNDDMQILLDSTEVATEPLDARLHVRR